MCPVPSIRQKIPRICEPFGGLAYNISAYFGESKHYISWFAAEVTGDNLLPVMGAWLH